MSRATAFLDRFRAAGAGGAPLELVAADPDGFGAAIAEAGAALAAALDAAVDRSSSTADLDRGSFASAACDASGTVVVADAAFRAWLQGPDPLSAVVRGVRAGRPHVSMIADDATGRPVAVAAGCRAVSGNWPLDMQVRAAVEAGTAVYAIVAFRPGDDAWNRAARAHGLTPAETRMVTALARAGELQAAAAATGIAYETARKLVASAMAKTGTRRQTDLVRHVLTLAAGDFAVPHDVERLFADLFGLTLRQAQLTRGVALGSTREAAAAALGISVHAAKADLRAAFTGCGVATAVDLARIVAEVDALAGLATACDVDITLGAAADEPLRLVARSWAAGRIAVADHGPPRGRPVVIFHTTTMGRAISPSFIAALQAAGFRPIMFERAGFGLSDAVAGDPYATATRDLEDVLDALALRRVALLSRGHSTGVVTAAATMPDRVVGGVLLGPDPPVELDRSRKGLMGRGRQLFYDHPQLAEGFAKLLSRRTSSAAIERMMYESIGDSVPDKAVLDTPAEMRAIVRASRQCALGMKGFLNEILAQGGGARPPALTDARRWSILSGDCDALYRFDDAASYWRGKLPGARVVKIADGGRFLHVSHPAAVAAALHNAFG